MAATRALSRSMVEAVVEGRHQDPFAVPGVHEAAGHLLLRAFVPGAESVDVVSRDGEPLGTLRQRHAAGLFEGTLPQLSVLWLTTDTE